MAQSLLDRIATCLRPNGRLADCRRTLSDAEKELGGIDRRIAEAERNSTNPSVTADDARLAWERAEEFRLDKRRIARGIDELRRAIALKEEAQHSEERARAYAQAKTSRDALTERWKAFAEPYAQLMQLLAETYENDQLLARINRMLPAGDDRLRSAEVEARGALNDERWSSGAQFNRLTNLEWDNWGKSGLGWSLRQAERSVLEAQSARDAASAAAKAAAYAAANTPEGRAEAAKAEAERYSRFTVKQTQYNGSGRILVRHRDGIAGIGNEGHGSEPVKLWLDAAQVAAAKAAGMSLELLPAEESKEPEADLSEALEEERV